VLGAVVLAVVADSDTVTSLRESSAGTSGETFSVGCATICVSWPCPDFAFRQRALDAAALKSHRPMSEFQMWNDAGGNQSSQMANRQTKLSR